MLFDVAGVDIVHGVQVSMAIQYPVAISFLGALLTDPSGKSFEVIPRASWNPLLSGTYTFSDAAPTDWRSAVGAAGPATVAPGTYRTVDWSGARTYLDDAFAGRLGDGTWSLTFTQCFPYPVGSVFAASLTVAGSAGVQVVATPSSLGPIPDGSGAAQSPGSPRDVTFVVPPVRGPVSAVRVSLTLAHPYAGDLVARLIAPTGETHVLFGYSGATAAADRGSSTGLNGTYEFLDGSNGTPWWANVIYGTNPVAPGSYNTSELGGPGATGVDTAMDPVFAGATSTGTWTLRISDGATGSVGAITAASLQLETRQAPSAEADAYSTVYPSTLSVASPGVLANDRSNNSTGLTVQLVTPPANGTLVLQPGGGFTYTPNPGFVGADRFTYRASSVQGSGTTAVVTIDVSAPTTVQAPLGLTAVLVKGRDVTLRWQPPPGPVPADYVVEGGVAPAQTLGAIAVGGPQPVVSFPAPTGVFFLRVHAVANGQRSGPSNEIRVAVGVPEPPSSPAGLSGLAAGDHVGLSWRNTFAGGEPSDLQLVVTGGATAVLPLPLTESFDAPGVPPGTYAFRVRARNASGSSAESNTVALTFPAGCTGAPQPPQDLLAYASGGVIHVYWDPGPNSTASTAWVLRVGGAFTGAFPLSTRALHAPAPAGSYTLAVAAQNLCGISAFTPAQTVFVP